MIVEVEYCTKDFAAGESAAREPCVFFIGGRRIGVEQIVDRWPSEKYSYIKIEGDDRATYILRHQVNPDQWELVLYHAPDAGAANAPRNDSRT